MQITGFTIEDEQQNGARHAARVVLELGDRIITLFCDIAAPRAGAEAQLRHALLQDALRQMGRMPEYRCRDAQPQLSPVIARDHALAA